jgi:DNA-binding transcriptional regulator YiaG
MGTQTSSDLEVRNMRICQLWLDEGHSYNKLAVEFGISKQQVSNILAEAGLRGAERKVVPTTITRLSDRKSLSTLHAQIGHDVNYARTTLKLSVDDFAHQVSMSRQKLRKIEVGVEDVTLIELTRLAVRIGISIDKLMTPRNAPTTRVV